MLGSCSVIKSMLKIVMIFTFRDTLNIIFCIVPVLYIHPLGAAPLLKIKVKPYFISYTN